MSLPVDYTANWNLVSLPLAVANDSVQALYPGSSGTAYLYDGSYQSAARIRPGNGYWLRFKTDQKIPFTGFLIRDDSVVVREGWNLIGSVTAPVMASDLTGNPPGMETSGFFGFDGGYTIADQLLPGKGYWVKVSTAGTIYLSEPFSQNRPAKTLRIAPTSERPPGPPGSVTGAYRLPTAFELGQNYPNPCNPVTTIRYALPRDARVSLKIYNLLGEVVGVLVDGIQSAGYRQIEWDASECASGVYFYRMEARSVADPAVSYSAMKKLVLLK